MDNNLMRLREATPRRGVSECARFQLRKDFEQVAADLETSGKKVSTSRAQYDIGNWVEFKRAMFEEFQMFTEGTGPKEDR